MSENNVFGMKRYLIGLLKTYPSSNINLFQVRLRGTNKLPITVAFFLNEILLSLFNAFVFRLSKREGIYLVSSQHLLLSTLLFPRNRSIIVCFDLIAASLDTNDQNLIIIATRRLIYHALKLSKNIIVISSYIKNDIIKRYSIKPKYITAIFPSIDTTIFHPLSNLDKERIKSNYAINPNLKILLFVGDETYRKNLSTIVKALIHFKTTFSNFLFIKIGKASRSSDRIKLKTNLLVNNLNLNTMLIDTCSDAELCTYYNIADVFLFPSLNEGFGLPPLESMACGTPVIVSRLTSLPEVAGNAAAYVDDPLDPIELSNLISILLHDNKLRLQLIAKGFEQVKHFSPIQQSSAFISLVNNLNTLQQHQDT